MYDRKVAGAPYCVGDLVWLLSPAVARGSSRKLHYPWKGPYRITEVITDVTYGVQQMRLPCRRVVVHYDRLKPYHGQGESSTPDRDSLNTYRSIRPSYPTPLFAVIGLVGQCLINHPFYHDVTHVRKRYQALRTGSNGKLGRAWERG